MHSTTTTTPSQVEAANIPRELRDRDQWVAWRYEQRDGDPTKIPLNPRTGRKAKSDDASTWGTFAEASACRDRLRAEGVGYMFSADDPFFGIDLDACRDPETGELTDWAREIIEDFDTYAEVSPGCKTRSGALYASYQSWCKASGEAPLNLTRFGHALSERGMVKKNSNGIWYLGVALAAEHFEPLE